MRDLKQETICRGPELLEPGIQDPMLFTIKKNEI